MAQTIRVPLNSSASISQVSLGGKVFNIHFVWMYRTGKWNISIYDVNDVAILEGVALQVNQRITGRYPSAVSSMQGELWMIKKPETLQTSITRDNVNFDFSLIYISTEELEEG